MTGRPRIPVVLLTGFLGSGKTTLVSRLMRDPRFSDTAVIINEFGEVGLDHLLVQHLPEEAVIEMTSGCLCCTVRGDVRRALLSMHTRSEAGELPLFDRVIIETTGLADPAPVIHTLMTDPQVSARFRLARVATVVDSVNGLATLGAHPEAVKQVAVADQLLLSKTDIEAGAAKLAPLVAQLKQIAPGSPIYDAAAPGFDLCILADDRVTYDVRARPDEVLTWLDAEAHWQVDAGQGHRHAHSINRHSDAVRAFCLVLDEPIDPRAFALALELLSDHQGPDLLRVKGLVALTDLPERPALIHMVQHLIQLPIRLSAWPSQDRRSRIVFITRNIDPAHMADYFCAWSRPEPEPFPAIRVNG